MEKSQLEAITLSFTETFNDNDLDAMMSYFTDEAAAGCALLIRSVAELDGGASIFCILMELARSLTN